MSKDIQKCISVYKKQIEQGDIQVAYVALTKFISELRTSFPVQYNTGNISFGYLDYTYFPFFNQYLRSHKLRFGIVLNHFEMQFELWLMGQNAAEQKKYWKILKDSIWNCDKIEMPKYSVLEAVLEKKVDFDNKEQMKEKIINRAVTLAVEIQQYLENLTA